MKQNKLTKTIALISMIIVTFTFFSSLNIVHSANVKTYAFLSVNPNPVGLGQTAIVVIWLDMPPPGASGELGPRWRDFTVDVQKPDGTTEVLGPLDSDAVGSAWLEYAPNQLGTYSFQLHYPGQNLTYYFVTNWYEASSSPVVTLTVQEDSVESWKDNPLPNDIWTRPINAENRLWGSISGNWLQTHYSSTGRFNPYTTGPESSHIMWTKEITFGGIVGGEFGNTAYYTGMSYETKFNPPVIMNGRLYYNDYGKDAHAGAITRAEGSYPSGLRCVDLRTGEELWYKDITIDLGQLYNFDSPNQHGVIPYLWKLGSTYEMYDAFTGDHWLTIENVTSGGIETLSPRGELLVYVLDGRNNWLLMWNSSKAIPPGAVYGTGAWDWRPEYGAKIDWKDGIQWNVTVPDVPGLGQRITKIGSGVLYARSLMSLNTANPVTVHLAYDAETGQQLWSQERSIQGYYLSAFLNDNNAIGEGVYAEFVKEKLQWYAFDVRTGQQLWVSIPTDDAWGVYSRGAYIAYGKLFTTAYDGYVRAYDLETGDQIWNYFSGNSGMETPYGTWAFVGGRQNGITIADGKVYACTSEHSPSNPLIRGQTLHVIDAETGEGIWKVAGWMESPIIADGYLLTLNGYDNRIYCFGKGPSAVTIEAPLVAITQGESVMLTGTVTDQSPGAKDTPAISDESMSEWMEYLHMQHPLDSDPTGVEVKLSTLDPNGNTVEIGTVTTDKTGMFMKMWTPEIPGEYTVIATFDGTESYGRAYAQTCVGVVEAPAPTSAPEPTPTPMTDTYIAGSTIAIIAAIGIAVLLLIRKK